MAEVIPVQNGGDFMSGGFGAGVFGGLLSGAIFGNGGFGWGGNRGVAPGSAFGDGMLIGLQNQISHADDAANAAQIETIRAGGDNSRFLGGMISQQGQAITGAIGQQTVTGLQSNGEISRQLCCINNNITTQGKDSQINALRLAQQMGEGMAAIGRQVFEENCKNRELQRQIQSENQAQQLADAKAQIAALQARIDLSNQLAASQATQTAQIIAALKPAATAAAG